MKSGRSPSARQHHGAVLRPYWYYRLAVRSQSADPGSQTSGVEDLLHSCRHSSGQIRELEMAANDATRLPAFITACGSQGWSDTIIVRRIFD